MIEIKGQCKYCNRHTENTFPSIDGFNGVDCECCKKEENNSPGKVVDLYVNDCGPRNFSLPFFKKINKILSETFVDSLGEFNIYTNSPIFNNVWKIIRVLIDRDTREKINIISV